jgi:hypothetical protein
VTQAQRQYWRFGRRRGRGDPCCTALTSDLFERNNPDLVLEEIRRGCIEPVTQGYDRRRRSGSGAA